MEPLTKRQQEILKYLATFIEKHGHGPTLDEIRRNFDLGSLATAHKHLGNLQTRGWIKRKKKHARSITIIPATQQRPGIGIPLQGSLPETDATPTQDTPETINVPQDLTTGAKTYALRVHGDTMLDEQLHDGDIVIVEDRTTAENGETVLALIDGSKTAVRRITPDEEADPPAADPPRDRPGGARRRPRAGTGHHHRDDEEVLNPADPAALLPSSRPGQKTKGRERPRARGP